MPRYAYDRLSAQDLTFLLAEGETTPMHVGGIAILEAEALISESGGIDIGRYRKGVESVLHRIPRYRQKLSYIPFEDWPVWIDDRHFDIGYHIRHIALPRPGSLDQLHELAGRILSRHLDRDRPLWELWVIEGLHDGEQVALLNKIHHCMIDGAAGADLSQILLSPSHQVDESEPIPYYPRPAPGRAELLQESLRDRLTAPFGALRDIGDWLGRNDGTLRSSLGAGASQLGERLAAMGEMAGWATRSASDTPLNGELSPHRRVDWITMPLDDVRELRRALGCTINDIVLTIVTGAVRRYLSRRRVDPRQLDFRIAAPVNVRREENAHDMGNHVSSWIVPAPLDVEDPIEIVARIRAETEKLKRSKASLAFQTLMSLAEYLPVPLLERGVGLASGPANIIVTNVPGPQFPLYSMGAKLLGMYPVVPLLPSGGLGIALFSYEGKLCWGFNADYQLVPQLDEFVADLRESFEALRGAVAAGYLERRTGTEALESAESAPAEAVQTEDVADAPPELHAVDEPADPEENDTLGAASASA